VGATVFATSLALLAQTFDGGELRIALGIWGAVVTLALGCGPVLGGLLTELSWRWIFYVNIPVGLATIAITVIGVQEFRPPQSRRIDLPGGGVFTLGLVALIYGLIESESAGWGSGRVIIALVVAVVALASFPITERAQPQPMFDLSLHEVLFIAACVAFVTGGLALVLIRSKDFHAAGARTPSDADTASAAR
jgi:MFS family permease